MRTIVPLIILVFLLSSCSKFSYNYVRKLTPFDAIIVPGVPFDGKEWDDVMKLRVYWSYILYERGYTKHIIYSGSAVYTPYYEAVIMKMYGEKLGIPTEIIHTDTIAEHSTENVWYSHKLADSLGFKKIALATDPFQNLMVKKFIRDRGLNVWSIPVIFSELDSFMRLPSPQIDHTKAQVTDFKSLEERESKWQRMKGTLGLKIEE
jgi:uncharacterized SAM-binding protein YcdF (DUF218 family)